MILKRVKIFILLMGLIGSFAFSQEKKEDLEVAIGIDVLKKFEYKFSTKIQVGNESILKLILAPAKQEIIFRGVKKGKTSVTIRDLTGEIRNTYIVNVTSDGTSNIVRELRELIGDVEGIKIGIKGGKVVVEGEIVVPGVIGKINTVLAGYPDVLKLVELSSQAQRYIARKMQEEINKNNMKEVTVRIVNGDFWLEGVVNGQSKRKLAEDIATQYLPDKLDSLAQQAGGQEFQGKKRYQIANFISVNEQKDPPPPAKLIKVTAQFVELTKNYQKIFGFSWSPAISSDGSLSFGKTTSGEITTDESGTLSGTITQLFPKLSSGKSAGYARVLQSGMVIVKEGQPANITKDRPIPFAVGSGDFQQSSTTNISFNFSVTPSVGANETVDLKNMSIRVSIPGENAPGGQPTSISNTINTSLTVKSKESAAIGGIVQSTSNTDYDKDRPGTTGNTGSQSQDDTSPLFDLLRSKSYKTSKSQFVVFVTPEIIESASAGTEKIRKKFKKRQR